MFHGRADGRLDGRAHDVSRFAGSAVDSVSEVLDTSLVRGNAALEALRGGPVRPPVGVRRWPWAVVAAVLGAAAGAAVATLAGRLIGTDAPDAQEPEDVQAVIDLAVDRPGDLPG